MVGLVINTPNGEGELKNIYLSELGYLMVKVENDNVFGVTFPHHDLSNQFSRSGMCKEDIRFLEYNDRIPFCGCFCCKFFNVREWNFRKFAVFIIHVINKFRLVNVLEKLFCERGLSVPCRSHNYKLFIHKISPHFSRSL